MYLSPSSDIFEGVYAYQYPTSDEAILSEINPSLVQQNSYVFAQINIKGSDNEKFTARQNFVSWKRHYDIMAESLSEIWGIGPKRAKATLLVTTQNETISTIMPLS